MSDNISIEDIDRALAEVESEVLKLNNPKDIDYFRYHEKRFYRMAKSLVEQLPKGSKVLDIGSHFLHPSMILRTLGYEVHAVDVPVFFEMDFIRERRERFQIQGICESNLETFQSVNEIENEFDGILFTEILEHITFNPVSFWKQVYQVLKPEAMIYLTTPNSLALPSILRAFMNLVLLRGIGIKVSEILRYETYGHHWKEYSRSEIRNYFQAMSDDFMVRTGFFSYHQGFGNSLRDRFWFGLARIGLYTRVFAPNLESIIKVSKGQGFKMKSPEYL